jgi:MoxR-like ATPase
MILLVNRTRNHPDIELGISPRGTVALFRAAQALALVENRTFVIPDDIKKLAVPVFGHRLAMARTGTRTRTNARSVLGDVLNETPIPA